MTLLRSWLSTCSSSSPTTLPQPSNLSDPPPPTLFSSESSTASSNTSLDSNLSLQSHPSVPSLQLTNTNQLVSVSHSCNVKNVSSTTSSNRIVTCIAISGALVYAASGPQIDVFDLATTAQMDSFNNYNQSASVKSLAFSKGKVLSGHQDCKIRVWQIKINRIDYSKKHLLIATLPTITDRLYRFALPHNYVPVRRHKKRLWIEHADTVSGLAVSSDEFIVSVSWDKCLKIWRAKDLMCVESVKAHEDAINAVAVSADGVVYTGSADSRIKVWARGPKRYGLVATLERHRSAVNALALSEDGSVLFSGACDRSILVWEREDSANHMSVTGALRGHTGAILCLRSVSDLVVSGSADRTVRIWRRGEDGRFWCVRVLEGHEKGVKSIVAVSDEEEGDCSSSVTVCSGGLDGEVKVWRVRISRKPFRSNSNARHLGNQN
ncbi:hypothetical protein Syun_024337 [Stephania yunnanensis]|uniref:Uncharacterized protein n=1 Tax=Stephania yunnanensis TaxID=152371 RepID=A0AAP0NKM1_9MAGN